MLNMRQCIYLTVVLPALLPVGSSSQTLPQSIPQTLPGTLPQSIPQTLPGTLPQSIPQSSQEQYPEYIPLFNPEQIAKASESARKRMQATEKMNREAWLGRRKKSAEAKARKEADQRAAAEPAAPQYTRKGKIYKSVDAQGRVVFGDAPTGKNSQQIKLRNTRPPEGAPPPAGAPSLKNDEDS